MSESIATSSGGAKTSLLDGIFDARLNFPRVRVSADGPHRFLCLSGERGGRLCAPALSSIVPSDCALISNTGLRGFEVCGSATSKPVSGIPEVLDLLKANGKVSSVAADASALL